MATAIISYVDDLVEAVRLLAAALIGKASHPDPKDDDEDKDET